MSADTDRPASPAEIGSALAVIATVTIGVAVERILLSLGIGFLAMRGVTAVVDWWFVLDGDSGVNLLLSGAGMVLLTASLAHSLLRRTVSRPDL